MNKFFDNFYNYSGFGPAIKATYPTAEVLDHFSNKLPTRLLEYWQEYGFCGWGEGLLWIVNPDDYKEILATWLTGTPFENQDNYYVIAKSCFGDLTVWGEKSGFGIYINACYGMIFPTVSAAKKLRDIGQERTIDLFFATRRKESFEINDLDEKPLFERALAKLGPLAADEMDGFVPALAIGGAPKLENLRKVKVLEHSAFLADLGEKRIMADIVAMSNALHGRS